MKESILTNYRDFIYVPQYSVSYGLSAAPAPVGTGRHRGLPVPTPAPAQTGTDRTGPVQDLHRPARVVL
jgi:hypothetical protein